MCDYSLESVKSRAATNDEELVVKRFASGSKGFISKADPDCAVCCKSGVEMTLTLNGKFQTRVLKDGVASHDHQDEEFAGEVPVTFHTLVKLPPSPWGVGQVYGYKDGFILPDGRFMSMQALSDGVKATVTKALPKEIADAATQFDADIRMERLPDYTRAPERVA